jgi:hypothetical protein
MLYVAMNVFCGYMRTSTLKRNIQHANKIFEIILQCGGFEFRCYIVTNDHILYTYILRDHSELWRETQK